MLYYTHDILYHNMLYLTILYYTLLYYTILAAVGAFSPGLGAGRPPSQRCRSTPNVYMCMYMCMCVYIYIYIYIHIGVTKVLTDFVSMLKTNSE